MKNTTVVIFAKVILRTLMGLAMFLVLFFWPAGTWDYWQAWVFIGVIMAALVGIVVKTYRRNRAVIERRLKTKEKSKTQQLIIMLSLPVLLGTFVLPGFDKRYGWSHVPAAVSIIADLLILASFYFYYLVMRENEFAGRTIEVVGGQNVISSGPYAVVRHPMYLSILLFYLLAPLALGSWWALLPALLVIPVLVARILSEERTLAADLPGYTDYMHKTRHRLIPQVW
ncbi:MAG: methyltransferase family protein [Anaerolineae bacterium]